MVTSPVIRPNPIHASSSSTAKDSAASRPIAPAAPRLPRGQRGLGRLHEDRLRRLRGVGGLAGGDGGHRGGGCRARSGRAGDGRMGRGGIGLRRSRGLHVLRPVVPGDVVRRRGRVGRHDGRLRVGGAHGVAIGGRIGVVRRVAHRLGGHGRHGVVARGVRGHAVSCCLGLGEAAVGSADHVVRGGRLCDGLADRGLRLRSLGITHRGALLTRGTSPPCESTPGPRAARGGVPLCVAAACRCVSPRRAAVSPRVGRMTASAAGTVSA